MNMATFLATIALFGHTYGFSMYIIVNTSNHSGRVLESPGFSGKIVQLVCGWNVYTSYVYNYIITIKYLRCTQTYTYNMPVYIHVYIFKLRKTTIEINCNSVTSNGNTN